MTDRYGVIGHPIAHSKSPVIHRLFAEATGQDITYEAWDIAPEVLAERVRQLFAEGVRGLNVNSAPQDRGCPDRLPADLPC